MESKMFNIVSEFFGDVARLEQENVAYNRDVSDLESVLDSSFLEESELDLIIEGILGKIYFNKIQIKKYTQYYIKLARTILKLCSIHKDLISIERHLRAHHLFRKHQKLVSIILVELSKLIKINYLENEKIRLERNRLLAEYNINKFNYNLLPVEECPYTQSDVDEEIEYTPRPVKYIKPKRRMNYGNILIGPLQEELYTPPKRSNLLLSKLRYIIDNLRAIRLGFFNFSARHSVNIIYRTMNVLFKYDRDEEECVELQDCASFEMEEPSAHGAGSISTNQASNVILTEARTEDNVITTPLSRMWSDYVSTDVVGNYNIITDRWMKLKDFEWTTQNGKHSLLFQLKLPYDAVYNAPLVPCDMPNLLPFRIHRYVRCDMEVKIQINSNKFQIGQLQASWFYQPDCDSFFDLRENVFSGSQTHHVLISASASNEASLLIPFKYHLPMVSTKARSDISFPLNIGTLKVRVLNPLSVTQNGPTKCNGVVFIRFMNCEFTGMIDGSMDLPSASYEMDRIVDLGANILKGYLSANEDNPPDRRVANYIVPTATHSWSMGTDIAEPLQMLRLSNAGRTMHPDVVENEQLVSSIASKFGLINTFEWDQSRVTGSILWKCTAAPILEMSCYNAIASKDKHILASYYVPPVGVVSSLFQYWRGSLEFRFDIIATQFHTGRLLVGYVPGATSSSSITLSQLYASPHMIFTLQENQTFTYQIPYIANKPFWSRNYVGNHKSSEVIPPSYLYVAVLNPLIPMESVVTKIFINVYMRGGPDFEVCVPAQPCFGLAFNRNVLYADTEIVKALTGYWPYYAGVWHSFLSSEYLIFRWGTASDEVAQFENIYLKKLNLDASKEASDVTKTYMSYYYSFENSSEAPKYKDPSGVVMTATTGLILYGLTKNYTIFVPILSNNVENAAKDQYAHWNATGEYAWLKKYAIKVTSTAANDYISGNPNLIVSEVSAKVAIEDDDSSFDECASNEGERESAETVLISGSQLTSTNSGRFLFGERFHDLMDLCRRYQLYGAFNVDVSKSRTVGQAVGIFPVLPQGLALDIGTSSQIVEIPNRCRDGHIPIVLSGFRYGRGSIRFRIVGPSGTIQAWVQHRPDRKLVTPTITVPSKADRAQSLFNHSYAYYVQDLNINSVMEFEVPFYQNSAFCLLQGPKFLRTDEAYYYTLGDISIGFVYTRNDLPDLSSSLVTIYYSLADDFQMSTFQGFPPMVLLDDIATPEMFGWSNFTNKIKSNIVNSVKSEVSTVVQQAAQGASDAALDKIAELKDTMEKQGLTDVMNTSIFRCIMTNIAHCTITTNLKHIVTAIISVFIEMGLVAYEQTTILLGKIMNVLNWVKVDNESGNELTRPDGVEVAEEAVTNMETPSDEAALGIITILWSGLCSLLSVTTKCPKDIQSLSSFLTKDMTNVMRSSNIFFIFLKNIFSVMGDMKQYLIGLVSPSFKLSKELEQKQPELIGWCQEVLKLEDPAYRKQFQYTQFYKQRVDMAYLKGSIFYRNILQLEHKEFSHQITKLYDKIRDLRDASIKTGSDSYIRKQCFTVWQCGDAGVGKSTLSTNVIMKLLKHRNIKTSVPPIYVHSTESDFWDTCVGNPAMLVDDLFNVQTGTIFEKHLILLFMLYSPVVLSPPKADLLDKGMTYNPEIFWINSNYSFFSFDKIHQKAIHRRRDVLFETKPNPVKKAGCIHCTNNIPLSDCEPELLSDNHHLEFHVYKNVIDSSPTAEVCVMDYPTFLKYLKDRYDTVMNKNEKMYQQRIEESMELFLEEEADADCMEDYIARVQKKHDANLRKIREASLYNELKEACKDSYSRVKDHLTTYLTPNLWDNKQSNPENDVWHTIMEEYNHKQAENAAASCLTTSMEKILKSKSLIDIFQDYYLKPLWHNVERIYTYEQIPLDRSDRMFLYQLIKIQNLGPISDVSIQQLFKLMAVVICSDRNIGYYGINVFIRRVYDFNRVWHGPYLSTIGLTENNDSLEAHVCICRHMKLDCDPELCFIENGVLYDHQRVEVDKVCSGMCECGKRLKLKDREKICCVWDSHAFKYMWYQRFIKTHPHLVPTRGVFRNVHISSLPSALKPKNMVVIPDQTKLSLWFQNVQAKAMEWVYKTYVVFGKIFKFISSLPWPLITCLLTGLVCSGSVAWGVYTDVNAKAQSIAQKQIKQGGAWESHSYTNLQNVNMSAIPRAASSSPQGSIPQLDVAIKLVMSNFFQITCVYDNKKLACHGVVLKSRKLLILRHYIEEYEAVKMHNPTFYGKFPHRKFVENLGVQFNLFDCKITNYGIKDEFGHAMSNYMMLELPLCFPESKCLTQFIATTKDHQRVYGECVLVQNSGKVSENIKAVRETSKLYVKSTPTTSSVTLYDKYTYKIHAKGMCGSILLCNNLERPIIGMHVAGVEFGNERGVSELLCLESFEEVIKKEEVYHSVVIPHLTDAEFAKININSMIYPLGCTDATHTVYQSGESSIIPSKIHGVFPVETAPNPLSKNDPRLPSGCSPLEAGCANFGKPPLDFETKLLDNATFDLQHKLLSVVKPVRGRVGVLDLETVICGNPDIPHFEPLEWKSSPGYPLRFEKRKGTNVSGKRYLFDLEEHTRGYKLKGIDPALQNLLTVDAACRERGIKPFTVFIDCLKDTTLPIEKCYIPGKTRVFSISPVQFTIQFKQYFLDFMASYQKARTNAEHGIGIDVNSLEWTHVANLLQTKGERIVCGDYKNFGPGLMKKAAKRAFDIILAWYELHGDAENNAQRKIFISEILDCPHLVQNLFYTTPCGIASGSPITTPLNDMCNGLYLRCAWEEITGMSFDEMYEHCVILHYGDDVCINVTNDMSDIFNTVTLRDFFEKYNIVFTDISKDGTIIPYRTLETCQFLKCGFKPHPFRSGVYVANLDKKSIQGCANWILKRNDPDVATVQNCETVLELAHGWGEEYYNECLNKMLKECLKVDLKFRALKWSTIDERRYSRITS